MDKQDWKQIVGAVAPAIATALGGPLAGLGVQAISKALLGQENASEADVAAAVAGATPDQLLALKQADQQFAAKMRELEIDLDKAYVADTADARHTFGQDRGVFRLGIVILVTFAAIMGAVLWGSFQIMIGGITIKDVAIVATVSGLVGTVVGYVAANAQQVVSYFFGSSRGSQDKTAAMSAAVAKLGQR